MKKNLKTYELIVSDKDDDTLVNRISLVSQPAIEIEWVAMSKDKPKPFKFKIENAERRYLTGIFMVPDQPIYRVDRDAMGNVIEEYFVIMSKETIEKCVKKFFKNGLTSSTNLEHAEGANTKDVYIIESWITTANNDKTKNYGFNVPEGSWAGTIFVENEKIWTEYIKSGELTGFSIEANMLKSNIPVGENFEQVYDKEIMELAVMFESFIKSNK